MMIMLRAMVLRFCEGVKLIAMCNRYCQPDTVGGEVDQTGAIKAGFLSTSFWFSRPSGNH